jgi:hypothetical protein
MIPIDDKLQRLGVKKFVKHGEFAQIILDKNKIIPFNINKKNFNQTIERFQDSAANGFAGLSRDHIKAICDVLVNPAYGYTEHLVTTDSEEQSLAHEALAFLKSINHEIFVDQFSEPFIVIYRNDIPTLLEINSAKFRSWLAKEFFENSDTNKFLTPDAYSKLSDYLIGVAQYDGAVKNLDVRITGCTEEEPYTIYYDLTNSQSEVVKITPKGWKILSGRDMPIVFRKYKAQRPQVYPSKKYPANILNQFIDLLNLSNTEVQREKTAKGKIISKVVTTKKQELFIGYLFGLLYPGIPKPVFMPYGGHNAVKSTTKEFVKMLIDPAFPALLSMPKEKNEMAQQLMHHYICFYDNLSKLEDWQSDQLCRAATKGGDSKRKLFTDDEDILWEYIRATGFSGIYLVATEEDLLSRGLIFKHTSIPDKKLRNIVEVKSKFNKIKPQLLGLLFDTMVKVLRYKKEHNGVVEDIKPCPRMIDFAEVADLSLRFLGYGKNQFIDAYNENANLQTEAAIDGTPLGTAIKALMNRQNKWNGTISELLVELEILAEDLSIDTRDQLWPKAPNALSRKLIQLEGHLKNLKPYSIVLQRYTIDAHDNIYGIEITKRRQVWELPSHHSHDSQRKRSKK